MAQVLLPEEAREALARLLADKPCPASLDPGLYDDVRRGRRRSLPLRGLALMVDAYGGELLETLGLKGRR